MLSVVMLTTVKLSAITLSVVMLRVLKQSVAILRVIMLSVNMQIVVMLIIVMPSVIILEVVAPFSLPVSRLKNFFFVRQTKLERLFLECLLPNFTFMGEARSLPLE
jgi:hypothetical protein